MHARLVSLFVCSAVAACASASVMAQQPTTAGLNWGNAKGALPPAPWQAQFHPKIKAHTEFELQAAPDGPSWLKIKADKSYGSWVYAFKQPGTVVRELSWQWRVEKHPDRANLRAKEGDDAAVKLCVFVGVDEQKLGFTQRMALEAARTLSGEDLPAATLCYVWAVKGETLGAVFSNPYTSRVRNMVLRAQTEGSTAFSEVRNFQDDALAAFGDELPKGEVRLLGIAVGGDSDNTKSRSVGYIRLVEAR